MFQHRRLSPRRRGHTGVSFVQNQTVEITTLKSFSAARVVCISIKFARYILDIVHTNIQTHKGYISIYYHEIYGTRKTREWGSNEAIRKSLVARCFPLRRRLSNVSRLGEPVRQRVPRVVPMLYIGTTTQQKPFAAEKRVELRRRNKTRGG